MKVDKTIFTKPYFFVAFFGIIYALISFVNHYLFRTAALDLGLYSNTLYDYAHFRYNNSQLIEPLLTQRNQLSDHFDIMLMILSPLYWVFGNYTLLLVQIAAILFGGYGVYLYIKSIKEELAIWAMIHFYSMWGIYSALAFDYHSNVIAAMMVPWVILYFKKEKFGLAFFFTLLAILCKENMALWLSFVWIGLAIDQRKSVKAIKFSSLMALFCLTYFIVILKLVMPAFAGPNQKYIHFFFKGLGDTPGDALMFIFKHPIDTFLLFFIDPSNQDMARGIKLELHVFIILSGGFALLLRPQYLIMLIPIYAQKLFHDDFVKWGIYLQYSIEFAPIISIALFTWIAQRSQVKFSKYIPIAFALLAFLTTLGSFAGRKSKWTDVILANPFIPKHYHQRFDIKEIHSQLNKIPDSLKVSASCRLVPHIANRRSIYCYPCLKPDLDLVFIFKKPDTFYPTSSQIEYDMAIDSLVKSPLWEIALNTPDIIAMKKKGLTFSF